MFDLLALLTIKSIQTKLENEQRNRRNCSFSRSISSATAAATIAPPALSSRVAWTDASCSATGIVLIARPREARGLALTRPGGADA